jgi:hypothetical protein
LTNSMVNKTSFLLYCKGFYSIRGYVNLFPQWFLCAELGGYLQLGLGK